MTTVQRGMGGNFCATATLLHEFRGRPMSQTRDSGVE